MTKPMVGGRRRVDRVLDPAFVEDAASLTMAELRERRADADQEETDLSHNRAKLIARIDLLRAEQSRRDGTLQGSIIDALPQILAGPGQRRTHGSGRHIHAEPSRLDEHRRKEEAIVADADLSDVGHLSDDELTAGIAALVETEHEVSEVRRDVQHVVDFFQAEIARRYREGLASVDDLLTPPGA
jgi:hypothetical protein